MDFLLLFHSSPTSWKSTFDRCLERLQLRIFQTDTLVVRLLVKRPPSGQNRFDVKSLSETARGSPLL